MRGGMFIPLQHWGLDTPENLQTSLCVQGKGKEKLQRKKNIKKPHVQLHLPLQLIQTKSFKSIHSDLQRLEMHG